jgi:hypothetical protein
MSEMFRTAAGHTLYGRTIIQEIREELSIHNLGKIILEFRGILGHTM